MPCSLVVSLKCVLEYNILLLMRVQVLLINNPFHAILSPLINSSEKFNMDTIVYNSIGRKIDRFHLVAKPTILIVPVQFIFSKYRRCNAFHTAGKQHLKFDKIVTVSSCIVTKLS